MEDYSRSEVQFSGSHGRRKRIWSVVHQINGGLRSGESGMDDSY
jgi:hypothetical protein